MLRSIRWTIAGLALVALIALSSTAGAQPPKPGGGPRGQFGMGMGMGMGGGMMQSPVMMWGMLLQNPKVQKEIELVDEQKTKLNDLREKATGKMREMMPDMRNFRDLSESERQEKMAEARKKMESFAEEQKKAVEEILLPHQVKRLKEISLQLRGLQALEDKDVQEELKFTDAQKEELKKIRESLMTKAREMFRPGGQGGREGMREKMQALQKEAEEKVLGVLTAEQKKKFDEMKGEKFDISLADLMPRRGPGGPGGPAPKE